jgi:hypothetical protein
MIVAEVDVQGPRMKALNQGFRLIAAYIFGQNLSSASVPMTAPVTQQSGQPIPMTAPVTQSADGPTWKVRFIMPRRYTLETLPKPRNPQVRLIPIPARKIAAIRFSGFNTDQNLSAHRDQLLRYLHDHHLTVLGPPDTAFYNPPWTLPFLRRNEIMFDLP